MARAVAQRRTLARSCDEEDEAAQVAAHDAHFMAAVAAGAAKIDAAHGRRRPAAAGPAPAAAPPQVLPRGGRQAQSVTYHFESDDEGVVYESDEEEEQSSAPAAADQLWFIWRTGVVVSLTMLLEANVPMETIRRLPLYRPQDEDTEMGDDDDEGMLQRTLARNFDPTAPRTKQSPTTKVHTFTGFPGDNPAALATGVAEKTKVKRRGLQAGTPTDTSTRPPGWWAFIPLTGMGPGLARSRYIMGHLLNKDFGGRGDDMVNLSVFTSRLNSHHKVQVENPLRAFLKGADSGHTRSIDYTVTPVYGTPTNVINDTTAMFDNFLTGNRNRALAAWVSLGLIDPLDVPNLLTAQLTDAIHLTKGGTWDALITAARADAIQYVTDHFPQAVVCTARQYDQAPGAAAWDKTVRLDETIQHLA